MRIAIAVAVMVTAVAGCAGTTATNNQATSSAAPPTAPSAAPVRTAAPTKAATPSPAPTLPSTTEVATEPPVGATAIEMTPDALTPRFKPDAVTVKSGTATFFLTSVPISGTFGPHHNMVIGPDTRTPLATSGQVQPGTSAVFSVEGLQPGTYRFWCTTNTGHGLHLTLGMVGTLTVK